MTTILSKLRVFRAALAGVQADEIIEAERARRLVVARAKTSPAQVQTALTDLRSICDELGASWMARETCIESDMHIALAVLEAAFSHPGDQGPAADKP